MKDLDLLGPFAWGEPCGSAQLKATAEDFQVDEVLDIPLSGQGEHLWLWVEKRLLNTEEAARRLAKAAGVSLRQISYAGLKDRQALTRQWFSIQLPGKSDPDFSAAEAEDLRILDIQRHSRKLQRGAHAANGFRIRLTELNADHSALEERLQRIAAQGVPNYFGLQRFGENGNNLLGALDYAQRKELPIQRNLRSRLLSTGRSAIFNRVLAQRVQEQTWNIAQVGDVLAFSGSRSFFLAGAEECQDPRLAQLDVHPTGPLWGEGELVSQGQPQTQELAVAALWPALCTWLERANLKQERRILRLPVRDLSWTFPAADCLQVQFVLPPGCFATVVLREMVELLSVTEAVQACEF
ncbi:MAG: tRNA pseudouridine(13) synthase TruD [Pseudomonas sp.]|jgi:tRNA pseudouridine13 synthase|nr:tRNA pseudouridine(13) synthase TruD [Pseudomonas sp.]MDD2221878.1 tRNA pseudouridine(13) synthase TruD [Pseudomonas sp.]MDY0413453.1 tRNA pseudouridine(13) synthase TruD [Pseudomonas sp.]NLO54537.1 tRNA pseudouridine(13) synthase TruD [Gammaproteobacteria bacterium]